MSQPSADGSPPYPDHTPRPPGGPAVNLGVQQYGGHSQVGNQAVGPGARAVAGRIGFQALAPEQRERAAELMELIELLLERHRAELPDQRTPRVELRRLREELDEGAPEPGVVRRALERLTAFVQPVAPLATAVGELAQVVQSF